MARSWDALSPDTRHRYTVAGRTGKLTGRAGMTPGQVRAYYERGGDLKMGRGYHERELPTVEPPTGRARRIRAHVAPEAATERAMIGQDDDADQRAIRRWRERDAPGWAPRSRAEMGDDTVAILSRIGAPPTSWQVVSIDPVPRTGRFTMTVKVRGGYERVVILPDADSVHEVTHLLNERTRRQMAASPAERRRLDRQWKTARGKAPRMRVNVSGTNPRRERRGPSDRRYKRRR